MQNILAILQNNWVIISIFCIRNCYFWHSFLLFMKTILYSSSIFCKLPYIWLSTEYSAFFCFGRMYCNLYLQNIRLRQNKKNSVSAVHYFHCSSRIHVAALGFPMLPRPMAPHRRILGGQNLDISLSIVCPKIARSLDKDKNC